MYKNLRIIFTVISALCIAAILPVGAFWQFNAAITLAALAGIFYFAMLICKQKQEELEAKDQSDAPLSSGEQKTDAEDNEEAIKAQSESNSTNNPEK